MLQYLSGIGIGKSAKRVAKKEARVTKKAEKKAIAVTKKQAKKSKLTPVTKSRINKLQVQSKIRKAFVKKAEPIKVTEEEIIEEVEQPTEEIAEERAEETPTEETQAEATEESEADLGVYYPEFGKPKKKLKIKVPKLKGKLKSAVKKAKQRLKDDKHKPAEKVAHQLAKQALLIPRGAFLAIMLLGKALEKTPIKINIGKKVAEVWNKKNKEIKEFWYKVGGEADILETQIKKFQSSKISGELGSAIAAGGSVAAASPIVVKFLKIVGKAKEFAEKNPKLLAQGQALVKKGIEQVAKKNPEQLKSLNVVADEITKVLPPDQQAKINKIRTAIPKSTIDKVQKTVVSEVKNINEESGTTPLSDTTPTTTPKKSNTMLYAGIGGAVLIGAFLLMKKKK